MVIEPNILEKTLISQGLMKRCLKIETIPQPGIGGTFCNKMFSST